MHLDPTVLAVMCAYNLDRLTWAWCHRFIISMLRVWGQPCLLKETKENKYLYYFKRGKLNSLSERGPKWMLRNGPHVGLHQKQQWSRGTWGKSLSEGSLGFIHTLAWNNCVWCSLGCCYYQFVSKLDNPESLRKRDSQLRKCLHQIGL